MYPDEFLHTSTGSVLFDPGKGTKYFDPWWALLLCDDSIPDYYAWFLRRKGIELDQGSRWGTHICFVRGEQPPDSTLWGIDPGPITFHYSPIIQWVNGYHVWLNVWSPELTSLRQSLGLPVKARTFYHLTIGRLDTPQENRKGRNPRPEDVMYL